MSTGYLQNGVDQLSSHLPVHDPAVTLEPDRRRNSSTCRPATLALQDVNYHVKYRVGPWWKGACFRPVQVKRVLHDVTLACPEGQLIGIVGSSGSGKTSLLDVIAFRTEGEVTGRITYGGRCCTKEMMRQRVSYVIQADRLLPHLSVMETLTYAAYLKLPSSFSKQQVEEKVNKVLNRMGLRGVADSRVGGAVVRGISGGEKRRLTIGLQLFKDPDILLLDEPTTGLDSFTARHVVTSLQQLAAQGTLVILSVHQPRSDIVKLLDRSILMCQGEVMYYGPTTQLVPYFTELGHPCPTYANPLDTYLDMVSVDRRDSERQASTTFRVNELWEAYQKSDLLAGTKAKVEEEVNTRSFINDKDFKTDTASWFRVYFTVVRRMYLNLWRDRRAFFNRMFLMPLFVPFIVVFLGRLKHTQSSIQDRIGLLYNTVQVPPYLGILNNIALFPTLRDHFYREGLDGLYASQTFLLAYTLHILPFTVVASALFSAFLYWTTGMYPETDRFGMHMAVVFLLHVGGELLTAASVGFFRNSLLANSTTALFFTASGLLATGFLRSLKNMPKILQYLSWVSIHKYSSEIVVANEFHHLNLTCGTDSQDLPCMRSGDDFINDFYPGAVEHMARNFELLAGVVVFLQLLAIVSFKVFGLKIMK